MAYYWYDEAEKKGPCTAAEIQALARAGTIRPETIVESGDRRTAAQNVRGLAFSSAPPERKLKPIVYALSAVSLVLALVTVGLLIRYYRQEKMLRPIRAIAETVSAPETSTSAGADKTLVAHMPPVPDLNQIQTASPFFGVCLGDTFENFHKQFPDAQPIDGEPDQYEITSNDDIIGRIIVTIYQDHVLSVRGVFKDHSIRNRQTIVKALSEKYKKLNDDVFLATAEFESDKSTTQTPLVIRVHYYDHWESPELSITYQHKALQQIKDANDEKDRRAKIEGVL